MDADQPKLEQMLGPNDVRLAYRRRIGGPGTIVFLPGYASDMDGSKAVALDRFAASRGVAMLRFDYSGTGLSDGEFEAGTLGGWIAEAVALIEQLTEGPVLLVGSSMGGWIALHVALRLPERIQGLVGIAAAPDFSEWGFTADEKQRLAAAGRLERENPYGGEPQVTTLAFWKSAEQHLLLSGPIDVRCPVRLVHGTEDADVPLEVATRTMGRLRSADVQLKIIKGGGHRLSEPREIDAILRTVAELMEPTS